MKQMQKKTSKKCSKGGRGTKGREKESQRDMSGTQGDRSSPLICLAKQKTQEGNTNTSHS